eukprot:1905536-Amphidinium_carterae.2
MDLWAQYAPPDWNARDDQQAPPEEVVAPEVPAETYKRDKRSAKVVSIAQPSVGTLARTWEELPTRRRIRQWRCTTCSRLADGPGKKTKLTQAGCAGAPQSHREKISQTVTQKKSWQEHAKTALQTLVDTGTHQLMLVDGGESFGCFQCGRKTKVRWKAQLSGGTCTGAPHGQYRTRCAEAWAAFRRMPEYRPHVGAPTL